MGDSKNRNLVPEFCADAFVSMQQAHLSGNGKMKSVSPVNKSDIQLVSGTLFLYKLISIYYAIVFCTVVYFPVFTSE